MSKKLLFLFPFMLLFGLTLSAQINTPPCPDPPPPGANSCPQTCVYCDFDGYMGANNGSPSGGDVVCGAISLHNDQWFGFIAGTTDITIDILNSNCQTGDGLQAAFFADCDDDAIVCNPGFGGGGGTTLTLSYSGFVPGQTYYLMIDGYIGDVCDYEIDVTNGSVSPPAPSQASTPIGPTQVCPGATVVYSIPPSFGAGTYTWTAPPGSSINGMSSTLTLPAPDGEMVTITFGNLGGNVCVTSGNACSGPTLPSCLPVTNQPIPVTVKPPVVVCFNELPFIWDEAPYTPLSAAGTYTLNSTPYQSYLGCDSVIRQTITIKNQITSNIGFQYICEGECFEINGNSYCQPGTFQEMFTSYQNCDSIVNFFVVQISSQATIEQPIPEIDCNNPIVVLNSNGSSTGPNVDYIWSDDSWSTIGMLDTQIVNNGGTFHLVVNNSGGSTTCSDTTQVTVIGNTDPPGVVATGGIIGCLASNQSVTLTATSQTNGVNYLWTGPGITPANQNQQNPTVNVPGDYTITVTNPNNSCVSTATVQVIADNTPPMANAVGGTLSCGQPTLAIDGITDAVNATYMWAGPGINTGNETDEDPVVDQIGTYNVTITNTLNGCTNTATTDVDEDTAIPAAIAGADQTITCAQSIVTLTGNGDAGGAPIAFSWTGPGINAGNQNDQNPDVDQAGTYILTVTNTVNGCDNTDTVLVDASLMAPTADAGTDSILNCVVTSIILNGTGSSQGADFEVLWSGPGINAGNETFYSPSVDQSGTYTILVTNTSNGCTSTDDVDVAIDVALPTADAGADQTLTCATTMGVTLAGGGTPANITYLWSGPGIGANNQNLQNPTVTVNGMYNLVVTNPTNGCTATDAVQVFQDADVPLADAGLDLTLNCAVTTVDIDASNSTTGPDIVYEWSGPGINATNMNDQSPTGITLPGNYNLTVTNTTNNCVNTDVLVVLIDTVAPVASAGADVILNCFNNALETLDGSGSNQGANFSILWTGPGINGTNETDVMPEISMAGMYTIQITNTANNCVSTDDVLVDIDVAPPTADAGTDEIIDCIVLSVPIGGASSSGADIEYLWTGPGIDTNNETQVTPTVSVDGTYTLVVTNTTNGCTSTDDVVVTLNAVYPVAVAGVDQTITCTTPNITLDGTPSSNGPEFTYDWTGPDINAGNQNTANPMVTLPGTYVIQVTNTNNSCVSTDTVVIDENTVTPMVSAGLDDRLDCQDTQLTLDGSGSASGMNIQYLWTGPGITAGNQDLQSPVIDQPGNYTILVTDTDNGCTSTDDVLIDQDIAQPTADAGADLTLTCATPNQPIDGSGSSTGALFEYVWQGPGINTGNFDQQSPMVSDSGTYILLVTNIDNQCVSSDTVYVGLNGNLPATDAGLPQTLTCQDVTVMLDGSLSLSGPGIEYLWTGPGVVPGTETSITPTVNAPGAYTLLVTNTNNGCTKTDIVNVNQDILPPSADAGQDATITCATVNGVVISSLASSSGPEYTILWSGPDINAGNETEPEPMVNLVGDYTLVVTNTDNGCTATDVVTVNLDQTPPMVNAGTDQIIDCNNPQAPLDGSGSQVGGVFEILWSGPGININNETDLTPLVAEAGTYTLLITNTSTGCTATDQVDVTIDQEVPVITTTADTITCGSTTATITVSSSIPGSTFLWDGIGINPGNQTQPSVVVSDPGAYLVVVTAPNGCTDDQEVIVEVDSEIPTGAAEGAVLNCFNNSMNNISGTITTTGATGSWTGPNGFTSSDLVTPVTTPGVYSFTIVATNGCSQTINVNVQGDFDVPVAAALPPSTLDCNTTSITINAAGSSQGPAYTYVWTTTNGNILSGDQTLMPVANEPGDYMLVVTDVDNGCTNSVTVQVNNDPSVPTGFLLTVQDVPCFNDTDGFILVDGIQGGVQPFLYSLDGAPASATAQFTGLTAGDYVLTMEDANGCMLDTIVSITSPGELLVNLGDDIDIQLGESISVDALIAAPTTPIATVVWSPEIPCDTTGGSTLWCESYDSTPTESYYQNITVTDDNGCVAEDRILVQVRKDRYIYVPNVFNPESDNPINTILMIHGNVSIDHIKSWNIYDRWGELVHTVQNIQPDDPSAAWDGRFNGDYVDPAVYVWVAEVVFTDGVVELFTGDVAVAK